MRLIILDGLDAVGKDTHAQLIIDRYRRKGEQVIIRSHPTTDNFFGRKAKKALSRSSKINKVRASIYYMLDVLYSIKKYHRPENPETLVMVRYLMGTAYLPKRLYKIGYKFFEKLVPTSEYMFFLDAPPKELVKRVEKREKKEIFETLEELIKVRKKALILAKNWFIIDTSRSIEDAYAKIESILDMLDKKA